MSILTKNSGGLERQDQGYESDAVGAKIDSQLSVSFHKTRFV